MPEATTPSANLPARDWGGLHLFLGRAPERELTNRQQVEAQMSLDNLAHARSSPPLIEPLLNTTPGPLSPLDGSPRLGPTAL